MLLQFNCNNKVASNHGRKIRPLNAKHPAQGGVQRDRIPSDRESRRPEAQPPDERFLSDQ